MVNDSSFLCRQRPPFFSFKMGLSLATLQALKLSTAAYFFSAVMYAFLPYEFKGHVPMGKLIAEEIIFYMGLFVVFLCWEINHHLHQVRFYKTLLPVTNFFSFYLSISIMSFRILSLASLISFAQLLLWVLSIMLFV